LIFGNKLLVKSLFSCNVNALSNMLFIFSSKPIGGNSLLT
jgi:hypothetical protein